MREFVFVTTADLTAAGRRESLDRLLSSIGTFRSGSPDVGARLMLLLQRAGAAEAGAIAGSGSFVEARGVDRRMGLSAARNVLLRDVAGGLGPETVLAFPDDDAWYPSGVLEAVAAEFDRRADLDLLFCRYAPAPSCPATIEVTAPSLQTVISYASSNTMFLRGSLAARTGPFDETLGVGGQVNGGEDTEYALRAYHASRRVGFVDHPLVGHRAANHGLKARYYAGSLEAIARHASLSLAGRVSLLRKIAVGVAHVFGRRLEPREFYAHLSRHVLADRRWLR